MYKARGTSAAKQNVQNGDDLGAYVWNAHVSGVRANMVKIGVTSEGGTDSRLSFKLNSNGTLTERFTIKSNGYIGIGTNNPQGNLDVRGTLVGNGFSQISGFRLTSNILQGVLDGTGFGSNIKLLVSCTNT
jgi:hypothetical protein